MVIYYENSKGEKLDLLKYPYRTVEADFFDSDWEEKTDGYEKKVDIDVFGDQEDLRARMNHLYDVIGYDSDSENYGRLYVNGTFLRCNLKTSKKSGWKGFVYSVVELVFVAPDLAWVEEKTQSFYPQSEIPSTGGFEYPFDHPFDYANTKAGVSKWDIGGVTPSEFLMTIYGPCANPVIRINDYPYEVKASLDTGEYLIIDSEEQIVVKHKNNGLTENMFNERGYTKTIFEKLPPGLLRIDWSGLFGFDISAYQKRREARW